MMHLIWIAGRASFKDFASTAQAERYIEACRRNHRGPRTPSSHYFACEAVDLNDECTGLTNDPRHQGSHCMCRY